MTFYVTVGLTFVRHSHGKGSEHFACLIDGLTFEIYPQRTADDSTANTRFGFTVANVDGIVEELRKIAAIIVSEPIESEWGRRAVVRDFDGHTVELIST
ncbi:hypothetical protein ACX27_03080 [Nostoc piscinale CENA21]|uniref:VOC domain-containing protein n=2 Tax=Nostoc TaxID=1177 RepID=A0A0M5MHW6_9NOSO|nr:hypothetical protein ACX27_03080 [Nostoc piscinale CENA21]